MDPWVRVMPYQEYLRRTAAGQPDKTGRNVGPYMDEEQAREQFEATVRGRGIESDEDLVRANYRQLCEALADADVAVSEYELVEIHNLARHDYATVRVIIGWLWRAADPSGRTSSV